MSLSSRTHSERNQNDKNNTIGSGKDAVSAYFASITNPTTQHLHDDDVVSLNASQEDVERDYSSFCAGLISGAQLMASKLVFPESPEESVRRVWQQYQQLQEQIEQGTARTRRIA